MCFACDVLDSDLSKKCCEHTPDIYTYVLGDEVFVYADIWKNIQGTEDREPW